LLKIIHHKFELSPITEKTFTPTLSTWFKYRGVNINLKDSFQFVTFFSYQCPGDGGHDLYAWQGIGFDGGKSQLERIKAKDLDMWLIISQDARDSKKKLGASAVTGSMRVWPYSKKEMIPVY
jgi:hypothetical protein